MSSATGPRLGDPDPSIGFQDTETGALRGAEARLIRSLHPGREHERSPCHEEGRRRGPARRGLRTPSLWGHSQRRQDFVFHHFDRNCGPPRPLTNPGPVTVDASVGITKVDGVEDPLSEGLPCTYILDR